jgi:hypothetical protein
MLEFTKEFTDHLCTLSYFQLGMIVVVIFLLYFVEHLIYYNSIRYGAVSIPMGVGPSAAAATATATMSSHISKHQKGKRRR